MKSYEPMVARIAAKMYNLPTPHQRADLLAQLEDVIRVYKASMCVHNSLREWCGKCVIAQGQ